MVELLFLLPTVLRAALRRRGDLVVENLLLRHQLAALTRPTRMRPRLRTRDKLLWLLVRQLRSDWRRHLVIVRPTTVVRWHRRAWQLFWRWKSRTRLGRPRLSRDVQELIGSVGSR